MQKEYQFKANIGAAVWIISIIGMLVVVPTVQDKNAWDSPNLIPKLLIITSVCAFVYAFWAYAKAKGYSGWVGVLLPCLSVLGLIILLLLKDRHPHKAGTNLEPTASSSRPSTSTAKLANATNADIILSLILPGWGIIVGMIALLKGELRRATTMILLSGVLVACYAYFRLHQDDYNKIESSNSSTPVETELALLANQANRSVPQKIDDETRLDGAVAGPGTQLSYRFTLVNYRGADVDPSAFDSKVAPTIRESNCKSANIKALLDRGVTVKFEYRGSDGISVGAVMIDSSSCKPAVANY